MNFFLNFIITILISVGLVSNAYADTWTENFDDQTATGYLTGFTCAISGTWTASQAGNFGLGTPRSGTKCVAINDNKVGAHITTKALNTCGTVSFYYYQRVGDAADQFLFQKSIDGVNWTTLVTQPYNVGTTYTLFTYNVNESSPTTYIRVVNDNKNGHLIIDDFSVTDFISGPEINVKETATNYLTGSTYNFGTATVGTNIDIIFTIENTGATNLTITTPLTVTGDYTVLVQPTSPVIAGGTTTFTIRFTPSVPGTRPGSVTIVNNDSDEASYVINFTGIGVAGSSSSDIISNTAFVYPANINYLLYPPTANITTGNSIEVYKFDVRDGGATSDADALSTTLTDITFTLTNSNVIDRIALYDGTTELAEVVGGASISFTGLNAVAADNGSKTLTLRVTFQTTVVDNTQFSFTTSSATADINGSVFAAANAGGSVSSTAGDDNRLEVIATTISWGTQPVDQTTGVNLASVSVNAVDVNGNTDLDENTCTVAITTTGTGITSGSPYTFINGVATMSDIQFSAANTGITLTATAQACLGSNNATSGVFNITVFTYVNGDWRTTVAGAGLAFNGYGWESFNGTVWTAELTAPQNIAASPTRIIIRHASCDGADNTGTNGSRIFQYNDIIITNGGELILNDNKTGSITATWNPLITSGSKIEVQNGGILRVNGDFDMGSSTRSLILMDGSKMYLNQPNMINTHMMWAGTEDIQDNSEIIIQDWDFTASVSVRSFLNPAYQIPVNSSGGGYRIGHLTYDYTPVTNDQTILPALTGPLLFCNNLTINNKSTTKMLSVTANKIQNPITTIGGNYTLQQGLASIGINYTADGKQQVDILGNMDIQNTNPANPSLLYLHYFPSALVGLTFIDIKVGLYGDMTVASGATVYSHVAGDTESKLHTRLYFSGSTLQTVTNAGIIELSNVHINNVSDVVIASGNFIATDSLTFDNGHFRLQGTADITLGATTVAGIETGAGSTKYVSTESTGSYIKTNLATGVSHSFPVGPSITSYNPAIINYTGTVDDFSARVEVGLNPTTGNDPAFVNRTWNIAEGIAGGTTASLTLQWDATHENGSFNRTNSNIYHYTTAWGEEMFSARAGAGPYTCTDINIASFSPFTVGTTSTLPIELLYFNAEPKEDLVELNWVTLSEINNDYFEIQKSTDGFDFRTFANQKGAGTSLFSNEYTDEDFHPFVGISYYRLKQVDFNGDFSYSNVKVVHFGDSDEPVLLQNSKNIFIKNNYSDAIVYVFDLNGKILKKCFSGEKINLTELSSGVYIIKSISPDKQKNWKVVLED